MTDLTQNAIEGWRAHYTPRNPHLFSSPNWYAWAAGQALYQTGYCVPTKARMGRGYSVNVQTAANDFIVKFPKDAPVIERKG